MRVLIVAPRYKPYGQFYELPLGPAYISSYLKSKNVDTTFVNLNEYPDDAPLLDALSSSNIICVGGLSVHYQEVKRVLNVAKTVNPAITTIIGGGLLSSEPELMMEDLKADIGIIGEGEQSLYKTIVDLPQTPIVINEPPIQDLDSLPFPDYEGLGVKGYLDRQLCGDEYHLFPYDKPRALPVISSRSCPFSCSFCFHPLGKQYRQRSLDNVFAEVEMLIDRYQINILVVFDELISSFPDRIDEFCQRIRGYHLKWMTQMRVDSVTQKTLERLKESGCYQISYGIESADNSILASMNKHTTVEKIEQALEWTYEAGIGIQGNFIFGDKAETAETAKNTLEWWAQHKKFLVNLAQVIPYPGSDLYKYALESGIIKDRLDFIKKGCPGLRLSPAHDQVMELMNVYRERNRLPATLLEYKRGAKDEYRGKLFYFKVICPHCDKTVEYDNLYYGSTGRGFLGGDNGYRIACRICNQRFDLPPFRFTALLKKKYQDKFRNRSKDRRSAATE